MKRLIMDDLVKWKESEERKPLILRGARQVGKTWILQEFGKKYYENVAYFNFDFDSGLKDIFENSKDPFRIIELLSFATKEVIKEEKTLIIFDEIQECPNALNTLKYFCELAFKYHVVCAGSLLGIRLSKTSFPVGKVNFLDIGPMSFKEFLIADGSDNLVMYLDSLKQVEKIPEMLFNKLVDKLKIYLVLGGMPNVLDTWFKTKDLVRVEKIMYEILESYEQDFAKHTFKHEATKISLVWNSIVSQLAKENKKFLYQVVKEGARAREYEDALSWLNNANIIKRVDRIKESRIPISAYQDLNAFKIYMGDVGLLRIKSGLDSSALLEGNRLFTEFKGALTENFVIQHLAMKFQNINYFTFKNYEIDFVIQNKNDIIPIEVKSGVSNKSISLNKYNEEYKPKKRVRLSLNNFSEEDNLINLPLFMIEYLDVFL